MAKLMELLLLCTFAMWFGGFFFYVSFVVPTGTEVLGSAFDQGMITRRVTVPLNCLCGAAVTLMMANSIVTWKRTRSPARQIQMGASILILAMLVCLVILHPQIDAMIDMDGNEIRGDYDQFYFLHRLYLWASTIQWVAAIAWLFGYVTRCQRD